MHVRRHTIRCFSSAVSSSRRWSGGYAPPTMISSLARASRYKQWGKMENENEKDVEHSCPRPRRNDRKERQTTAFCVLARSFSDLRCGLSRLCVECAAEYTNRRTYYTMPPTDRLTSRLSPDAAIQFTDGGREGNLGKGSLRADFPLTSASSVMAFSDKRAPSGSFSASSSMQDGGIASPEGGGFSFVLQNKDRGAYDRGVSLEAKAFAAEAEESYRRTWAALHAIPGGAVAEALPDEIEEETGAVLRSGRVLYTAPFGETLIPASKSAWSYRNQEGEWAYQQEQALQARGEGPPLDDHALLNLRKERQLDILVSRSPDLPLLEKAALVSQILSTDFYPNRLVLQQEHAEAVMMIWSDAAKEWAIQKKKLERKRKKRMKSSSLSSTSAAVALAPSSHASISVREAPHHLSSSTCTAHDNPCDDAKDFTPSSTPLYPLRKENSPHTLSLPTRSEILHTTTPYLEEMRQLYRYEKQHAVAPTIHMMELLMTALSTVPAPSSTVEEELEDDEEDSLTSLPSSSSTSFPSLPKRIQRRFLEQKFPPSFAFHLAQRILLDCDRYVVLPTSTLLAGYIKICSMHDAMYYAVAQLRHVMKGLNVALDADSATELLQGLTRSGQVEEALAILARMEKIPMTIRFVHTVMETLLHSSDPLACFSVYHASVGSRLSSPDRRLRRLASLRPTSETFALLLLACEQSGEWGGGRLNWITQEMKRFHVKGSTPCLNLLLKGLLKEERLESAAALMTRMQEKEVLVWPDLARGFTKLLQS